MPLRPSNADLQRQITTLRDDNTREHGAVQDELRASMKDLSDKLDKFGPVIAAHEERLKAHDGLQGQIMWAVGILSTAILLLAGWFISHLSGGKP